MRIACEKPQLAAVLALGAQAAWIGSAWLTTIESNVDPIVVEKLLEASSTDTIRTKALSGKPVRTLRTPIETAWETPDAPPTLPAPLQGLLVQPLLVGAAQNRIKPLMGFAVGQAVGYLNERRSSRAVVADMITGYAIAERTVPRMLEISAQRFGDRRFCNVTGSVLTFADTPEVAARAASLLAGVSPDPSVPVALLVGNRIEFMAGVWGQAWRGSISVSLNAALRGPALVHAINDCSAHVLVCEEDLLPAVFEIADELSAIERVVVVGGSRHVQDPPIALLDWSALYAAARPVASAEPSFDDPVMILYTSGTTGPAKGVVISHHHYFAYSALEADSMGWGTEDHLYTPLPLNHAQAHLTTLMAGLVAGSEVTVTTRFSASGFWREAAECGATFAMAGPTAGLIAAQPPSPFDRAHTVRQLLATPAPPDLDGFEERFGVRPLFLGYGMTEGLFAPTYSRESDRTVGCNGLPVALFEVEIVDDHDLPLLHDGRAVGELVVRSREPAAMILRYHNNPEATAKAFRNLWFHTDDFASIDGDGYLYLRGRKSDSMRRRGENVSANEIETPALLHRQVAMAAAFAVPSTFGDDDIKLDVVPRAGETIDPSELVEFLRGKLPKYMVPRYVQVRDEFPTTRTGKVEKHLLRAEGAAGAQLDAGDR